MNESTNGYIKLHRKLRQWGWYSDCVVKDVFLHLLIIATWREGKYRGYELHPGDAIIGRRALAQELGFSEQQVRTALKKLESTGEIRLNSTSRFTLVTVVNWAFYQGEDEESNQRATNKQPTDNQQITNEQPHLKKVRKKEGKKDIPPKAPQGGHRRRQWPPEGDPDPDIDEGIV